MDLKDVPQAEYEAIRRKMVVEAEKPGAISWTVGRHEEHGRVILACSRHRYVVLADTAARTAVRSAVLLSFQTRRMAAEAV